MRGILEVHTRDFPNIRFHTGEFDGLQLSEIGRGTLDGETIIEMAIRLVSADQSGTAQEVIIQPIDECRNILPLRIPVFCKSTDLKPSAPRRVYTSQVAIGTVKPNSPFHFKLFVDDQFFEQLPSIDGGQHLEVDAIVQASTHCLSVDGRLDDGLEPGPFRVDCFVKTTDGHKDHFVLLGTID